MGLETNNINHSQIEADGLITSPTPAATNNYDLTGSMNKLINHKEMNEAEIQQNHIYNEIDDNAEVNEETKESKLVIEDGQDDHDTPIEQDNHSSNEMQNHRLIPNSKSQISDLLCKLTESQSILSSSSSSSCVNSSGIGSTDQSPHMEYDLSRSPSSDTYLPHNQPQRVEQKRDGSVHSQGSCGTARSSSSTHKFTESKDGMGFLLNGCGSSSTSSTSSKKSRKEVIPQRKRRDFIPAELKDDSYWERRRKNNLAAKRSREKRRLNDIVLETKVLELTNLNNAMKLKLDLCSKKFDISEDEIDKMFEENKHLLVIQETLEMSELLTNEDSLTPDFGNDHDNHYLSSSCSTTSSKHIKSEMNSEEGLLLTHSSIPSSKMMTTDNSCSISTSSSHNIGSSGRSNSSCVDDVDCDGFNDAVSENELEIDENLDTIVEATIDMNKKAEQSTGKRFKHMDLLSHDEDDFIDAENRSPPSKRKSFFNPTHTSSCPSKSPSPTPTRPSDIDNNLSLSPIDVYSSNLKQQNLNKNNKNEMKKSSTLENGSTQMKSQYPLLYNQLCKTSSSSVKKQQQAKPQQTQSEMVYSLEQQNQMLLNQILLNQNISNGDSNPLMKTLISELMLRNDFSKQNNPTNNNSNISISSLLKQTETQQSNKGDLLTKILSSSLPTGNQDRSGSLLKPTNKNNLKPQTNQNPQANALMEKYKNLINKTNSNHNSLHLQANNHSNETKKNMPQNASKQNNQAKNTVNNLLQNVSSCQQNGYNTMPGDQISSNPIPKTKISTSASRKRQLNQSEKKSNEQNEMNIHLNNNTDLLNYTNSIQQTPVENNYNRSSNPADLNEMVAMMLAAQKNAQNFNSNRQNTSQRSYPAANNNSKNSNSAKNQTYNQLLMLHQTQKMQQQQRQHEAMLSRNQSYAQESELNHLTSPNSPDQLAHMQASQILYQQQQANFNKNDMTNCSINNQNSQGNNNAGGDNMPLKLRFKMLQLKTGEVN